jgi:hypothetical protein
MVTTVNFEERVARALVQGGFITDSQLEQARQGAGGEEVDLLENLVSQGFIGRETLVTALSFQLHVPVVDLKRVEVDPEALKLLPEQYAREHRVLAVAFAPDGSLRIATKSPNDFQLSAQLSSVTGRQVRFMLALGDGLEELIDRFYATGPPSPPQPTEAGGVARPSGLEVAGPAARGRGGAPWRSR